MQPTPTRIADRYELRSLLATGGMGQVWRAHDTLLGRDVALKLLRGEYTGDPAFLARFRAEARHTASLGHPNIATLFDYGETAGPQHLAHLVMELVEGESLSQLLSREGRLAPARAASVLRQTAAGLAAAHAVGVVHRDVKPGNVLVARDGTVKLTDFGIASSAASIPLTGTGQVMGTAHYLSPEQAQGAPATPASDVYALGLVAYEMLAGRRAFEGRDSVQVASRQIGEQPAPLPADVPAGLRALVDRMLVKDPARRLPDGAAVRDAVGAVLAGGLPDAVPPAAPESGATAVLPARAVPPHGTRVLPLPVPPATPPPGSPARSRRRLVAALAALLLVAAAVAAGLVLAGRGDGTPADARPTASAEPPGTTVPTTAEPAPSPEVVAIDAGDLVGRPVSAVQAELARLGLTVQLRPVTTADAADGEVLAVSPDGELEVGSTVTVTHAAAPPATPTPTPDDGQDDDGQDDDGGKGDRDGGNGRGHGHGRGHR
ncbi:serine/threonine protein kinase [Blastococcus sp. SYSU D00695]